MEGVHKLGVAPQLLLSWHSWPFLLANFDWICQMLAGRRCVLECPCCRWKPCDSLGVDCPQDSAKRKRAKCDCSLSCTEWRLLVPLGWHFQHPGGASRAASAGVFECADPRDRNRAQHPQDWWCGEWCWHRGLGYLSFTSTRMLSFICCASKYSYCVECSQFVCCLRPFSLLITAIKIKCTINTAPSSKELSLKPQNL